LRSAQSSFSRTSQGVAEQDHCEVLLNEDWAERNDPV
jgi:hypothetical protein